MSLGFIAQISLEENWYYLHLGPGVRVQILRIHIFLGLPDLLVRVMDPPPDPDPSVIKQKY